MTNADILAGMKTTYFLIAMYIAYSAMIRDCMRNRKIKNKVLQESK